MLSVTNVLEEIEHKSDTTEVGIEINSFKLLTKAIDTTIRDNSLYRLVEDLLCKKLSRSKTKGMKEFAILEAYRVEALSDNKAWLIHFETPPKMPLFLKEGFTFEGSHLRVDRCFANDNTLKAKQGLSACHATQQYRHKETGDLMVAHAYIGSNKSFIGCQIKRYQQGQKNGQQMEVTPLLKEIIYKNSEPELSLAKELLTETHNRYLKAEKKSYEIEAQLTKLLQEILSDTTHDKRLALAEIYQALIKEFLLEIALINRYNDQFIDRRGIHLIDLTAYMKPVTSEVKPTALEEETSIIDKLDGLLETDLTIPDTENFSKRAKSKQENLLIQEKEGLIGEIQLLAKALKKLSKKRQSENNQQLIEAQAIKLKLRTKLVELAFFPGITEVDNAFLKNLTEAMNKTVDLLDSFKEAVKLGHVEVVMQIYPHVHQENLSPIFVDFVINQLVDAKEERLKNLILMAEYFFEHSNCYRNTLLTLDSGLDNTLMDSCHIKRSLLFRAFNLDNYLAFELMLRQGFNPNGIGIAGERLTASLMNAIVYFMSPPESSFKDLRYLKALINFGALVNFKTPDLTSHISEHTSSIVKQKIIQKAIKKVEKTEQIRLKPLKPALKTVKSLEESDYLDVKDIQEMQKSALELICSMNRNCSPIIECLKLLAPESDLLSLIGAWVSLGDVEDICSRVVVGTKERYLLCCANKNEADTLNNRLNREPAQKAVSLIMYHTNIEKEKIWLQNIHFLLPLLTKKYTEILDKYPEQIISLYDMFIKRGKESVCLKDRVYFYTAALHLMLLNPNPLFQDTQKIVQALCFLGQTHYNNRDSGAVSAEIAKTWFYKAFLCCTKLQFLAVLQETPLFQYIEQRLLALGLPPQTLQEDKREAQALLLSVPQVSGEETAGGPIITAAVIHANRAISLDASVVPAGSAADLTKIRKFGANS